MVGLGLLFASGGVLSTIGGLGLTALATGVGVSLLLGPWIVRLWNDLGTERRQRIRSEERSEMAAHLHDVEVEPDRVAAFVRDRGKGFVLDAVEPGRVGVRESILGRMARHGGRAEVHTGVGEGTEVVVEVARTPARDGSA